MQVVLKPDPGNPQELYLGSLKAVGIDTQKHDVRFVEDNWENPALGAWGLGWEVWLDGTLNSKAPLLPLLPQPPRLPPPFHDSEKAPTLLPLDVTTQQTFAGCSLEYTRECEISFRGSKTENRQAEA